MTLRHVFVTHVILPTLLLCSCKSHHATNAFLLEETEASNKRPAAQRKSTPMEFTTARDQYPGSQAGWHYSTGNPIYVAPESDFEIRIAGINPGWVHQGERPDSVTENRKKWPHTTADQLTGKELWLLTTVQSQDPEDPFGLKSKTYVSSTNIKYDSTSFGVVPLSAKERSVFKHEADMAYLVSFKLYEVDYLELKRLVAESNRTEGGIGDLAITALSNLKGTLGSLIGDRTTSFFKRAKADPLSFERLLLSIGGELEFVGDILVLPSSETLSEGVDAVKPPETRNYVLFDYYKSQPLADVPTGEPYPELYKDRDTYESKLKAERTATLSFSLKQVSAADVDTRCYLHFELVESVNANADVNNDLVQELGATGLTEVQLTALRARMTSLKRKND